MKCPKCQADHLGGRKFCGKCGAMLEVICPSCKAANPPQFKFCGQCGHDLKAMPSDADNAPPSAPEVTQPGTAPIRRVVKIVCPWCSYERQLADDEVEKVLAEERKGKRCPKCGKPGELYFMSQISEEKKERKSGESVAGTINTDKPSWPPVSTQKQETNPDEAPKGEPPPISSPQEGTVSSAPALTTGWEGFEFFGFPLKRGNTAPIAAATAPIEKAEEKAESLYEAIIGEKNRIYYLTKFEEFDQQAPELKASWNWPAFFFGGTWALYRKMYGWFFALWGITVLSAIFEKSSAFAVSFIILAVPWITFAIFSNALYHRSVKKKIAAAQLSITDRSQLLVFLRYKGGVNTWVIWVGFLLLVTSILVAITIWQYNAYKQKGYNAADLAELERLNAPPTPAPAPAPVPAPTPPSISSPSQKVRTVEGPDGKIFNFPDDATDQEILQFMESEYGKKPSSTKAVRETGRDGHFIAYANGTVLDTSTNLMWAAKDNGSDINWAHAKSYCENYRGGGYRDWRMPMQDELAGLYYNEKFKNVITITGGRVWASETRGSGAAYVDFFFGERSWLYQSRDDDRRALPVRSGK